MSSRCRSSALAALPGGRLMDTMAERLFGFAAGNLLAIFTIVSIAASVSAMVLAGPRVYYAMARDGLFVRTAGARASALPHAGDRDRRAGSLERRARAVGDALAARELHGICRRAVLRRRGRCAVRPAPPRAAARPAVLRARLSLGAGDLRARERVMVANEIWRNGATAGAGIARHRGRRAGRIS